MAGEGKTFVTSNLVRAMVRQAERRVLVIDADLRCSRLHMVLGAPVSPGLSDYLRGTSDETSVIQHGGAGNLCLIPSGNKVSDPSELLSNGRFKTLLDRVGPAFDWVIIDSPPCLPVADAGVIANWCDGVLLVVRAGFTPSAVIAKSGRELKGRNVVGTVLNAVADDTLAYGSFYGYGNQKDEAQTSR
jgi:capsular exopolysaccharide synthesis family protein